MRFDGGNGTDSTAGVVDAVVDAAAASLPGYRRTSGHERALLLRAIAAGLAEASDLLAATAVRETGLSLPRLSGEIVQTQVNLHTLADWVEAGNHLGHRHDPALADFPLGPRPDMQKFHVPLGVVLNFAASNFPFAFSVAGVDTASALAAGCPVVVKAHPGHPETSILTFEVIERAISAIASIPVGTVGMILGQEAGVRALRDTRVKVASFTGSLAAGRALASIAAERPEPIPFYGELGSINPVVLTPGAIAERADALALEFVTAFTDSVGQVCTKPGLLFVPAGSGLDDRLDAAARAVPEQRMLYPRLGELYAARRDEVMALPGMRVISSGSVRVDADGHSWVTPTVVALNATGAPADVMAAAAEEVFGPLSVVVEYGDVAGVLETLGTVVKGSLTAAVHLAAWEEHEIADLISELQYIAGRVVINQWPMAVYVTPAQHHGGPFPATTLDVPAATSVGPGSIARFQRAVTWQNAPTAVLPREFGGLEARAPAATAEPGESQ